MGELNYNVPKRGEKINVMAYINLLYHIVFRPKNSASVIPIEKENIGFFRHKRSTSGKESL